MRAWRWAAAALVLACGAQAGEPAPPLPGARQTFSYVPARDGLALGSIWQPRFKMERRPKGGDNTFNGEFQFYADPAYPWSNGFSPFAIVGDTLRIRATRTRKASFRPGEIPDDPATRLPYEWVSGVLVSGRAFAQHGGYFEVHAKVPKGTGTWPAFWLLPVDDRHPPEIDIVEYRGDRPSEYHVAALSRPRQKDEADIPAGEDLSLDFHRYGVLWTDTVLTYYLDRTPVATKDISAEDGYGLPFYLLLNLAIGSRGLEGFVPPPDAATPSPLDLLVRSVSVWQAPGPTAVTASRTSVSERAPPGTVIAELASMPQDARVAYSIVADPDGLFAIRGTQLVSRAGFDFAAKRAHRVTIRATDDRGRGWQQLFTITVLDADRGDDLLAEPATWDSAGVSIRKWAGAWLVRERAAAARVYGLSRGVAPAEGAARFVLRADFKPAGRRWVKLEVASADYGATLKVFFDLQASRVGDRFTSSPSAAGHAFGIEGSPLAVTAEDGFVRCQVEFTVQGGGPLRVGWQLVTQDDEENNGHGGTDGRGVLMRNVRLLAVRP